MSDDRPPQLTDVDRAVIAACLRAAVDGPFFPEWEFHTLFGLQRDQVRAVLESWPDPPEETPDGYETPQHAQRVAVGNALNNLLGYPHGVGQHEFEEWTGANKRQISDALARWRDEDSFDPSGRGYFDRLT